MQKSLLVEGQMGHVARIYKTSIVGQDLTMDSTIVLFPLTCSKHADYHQEFFGREGETDPISEKGSA